MRLHADRTAGVYFLFSRGELQYVGESVDCEARLGAHRKSKAFDEAFAILLPGSNEQERKRLEHAFLKALRAPLNSSVMIDRRFTAKAEEIPTPAFPPIVTVREVPTNAPEMVPLPRAPGIFGLSRSGLYRLAAEGRIRMVKVGSRTFVSAASVRAFFKTLPEVQLHRQGQERVAA